MYNAIVFPLRMIIITVTFLVHVNSLMHNLTTTPEVKKQTNKTTTTKTTLNYISHSPYQR